MNEKRKNFEIEKYILTLVITLIIFSLGFFFSDYVNDKRFSEIDKMRKNFEIQILDMGSQITHFEDVLCRDIGDDILTHELHLIGEKLEFMAENLGQDHSEVAHLKKYYSLLQIRHYRFSQQLSQRCDLGLVHLIYFFGDAVSCPDCGKQGAILSYLREKHPQLRIYSFDYDLELLALDAIRLSIQNKEDKNIDYVSENNGEQGIGKEEKTELPIMLTGNQVFRGLMSIEDIESALNLIN